MTNSTKIDLAKSITITRRNGATVDVDTSKLSTDMIAMIFEYGLRQKVNDSASGAPETAESNVAMSACVAKLYANEWTARGDATPSDPLDKYRVQIVRKLLAQPSNAKLKASYDAIPSDEQPARRAFIMDIAVKNGDAIDPVAKQMLSADLATQKQAKGLDIAL